MKENLNLKEISTSVFVYTPGSWINIADQITKIDIAAFGKGSTYDSVRNNFSRPNFQEQDLLTVVMYSGVEAIGYSQAVQFWTVTSARIIRTAVAPEYQGQKLVGKLMETMEDELRKRGVETLKRKVRIKNGYADAIRRHYKERILADFSDGIFPDTERCFVIKL